MLPSKFLITRPQRSYGCTHLSCLTLPQVLSSALGAHRDFQAPSSSSLFAQQFPPRLIPHSAQSDLLSDQHPAATRVLCFTSVQQLPKPWTLRMTASGSRSAGLAHTRSRLAQPCLLQVLPRLLLILSSVTCDVFLASLPTLPPVTLSLALPSTSCKSAEAIRHDLPYLPRFYFLTQGRANY